MPSVGQNGRRRVMGEINVVPLVDVMLVLLIIFMVAAPMMVQGLDVNLPETDAGALKQSEELLILSVSKDGRVFLDEFQVEVEGLSLKLKNILSRKPKTRVYLRADRDVAYGTVVKVLAQTRKAGVVNLGMVTEPEKVAPPDKKKKS